MGVLPLLIPKLKMRTILTFFCFLLAFNNVQAQDVPVNPRKDYLVTLRTAYGEIVLCFFDETPSHKYNFLKLAMAGFYDSTTFHRVLEGFVIQGGDPNTKPSGDSLNIGSGGPGYTLEAEFSDRFLHHRGTVGAARQNDQLNPQKRSSGSQFYIVQAKEGAHHLDGEYTVFGKVLRGMEVVDEIAKVEVGKGGRPIEPVFVTVKVDWEKKKKISKEYGSAYLP